MKLNAPKTLNRKSKFLLLRETPDPSLRVAEFFAGIGLVRKALEKCGMSVAFANDIDEDKHEMYRKNFCATDFILGDIRKINGEDVPLVEIATASFPCTDLSLAGKRAGLDGSQSGMFWEFSRVLQEMGARRPRALLIENVVGFASSNGGNDLELAIRRLNSLGYWCDPFVLDAKWFVPQSRPRLFIVAIMNKLGEHDGGQPNEMRPSWLRRFCDLRPALQLNSYPLPLPPLASRKSLEEVLVHRPLADPSWWSEQRVELFLHSLSILQRRRLELMKQRPKLMHATAYRRTRNGKAVWEIRPDSLSGCLRTASGGSSKQAVVEAGRNQWRVRWMSSGEYAALQGAADYALDGIRESKAIYGFGDAVCVPAVAWIAKNYLLPILTSRNNDGILISGGLYAHA